MQIENGKIESDITVTGEFKLNGMVTGSIVISSGGRLRLNGMCCKDLIVEEGGEALVFGTVSGSAVNKGGLLVVYGVIIGPLSTLSGESQVSDGAVINGVKA